MFQRYTEKARRVIFFARYEASQYGNSKIGTEHLLLGLLREDASLLRRVVGPNKVTADIRVEIERAITRGERLSTAMEIPLTTESKKALTLAVEESDRLGHRHVGTEHLLLGILGVEGSLAAQVLRERGVKPETSREQMAEGAGLTSVKAPPQTSTGAVAALDSFLAGLKWYDRDHLAPFFSQKVQFVDSTGRRWRGLEEIDKQFEALFAPYAKKNVTFLLEGTDQGPAESLVASVLWKNVIVGSESTRSMHRMTVILAPEGEEWAIFFLQVTPVR